ncbi:SspB family protein [Asticcacaulis machinosus]|uniref:ClpXP protease specificity-enhancing factor SspB n=1 Tax=Asticcacaulis machinosus TaxID=2984211 RepID=A0ABT5HM55_9CAUL|nr:ClpXP protease specificity-enhancing factor SspB [Asticcacaulis machinosus]MDC7677328.1 ClpXP protease specificity-enhancing factor SspB [Asticcacaulis machinosus]
MSDDQISMDHMDYANLTQTALRGVIRSALTRATTPEGLPGEHHFYVTFLTRFEGVQVPADLLAKYPHDITIVLQHQFRDLKVLENLFTVTLSFGGAPKVLVVPYTAITRFYDPSVQFILEFDVVEGDEDEDDLSQDLSITPMADTDKPDTLPEDAGPKVVSLDQFRKK